MKRVPFIGMSVRVFGTTRQFKLVTGEEFQELGASNRSKLL